RLLSHLYSPRLLAFTLCFFFFNAPATTELYTLSLHDALPISPVGAGLLRQASVLDAGVPLQGGCSSALAGTPPFTDNRLSQQSRSEEHTSELQSLTNIVCRLLL